MELVNLFLDDFTTPSCLNLMVSVDTRSFDIHRRSIEIKFNLVHVNSFLFTAKIYMARCWEGPVFCSFEAKSSKLRILLYLNST